MQSLLIMGPILQSTTTACKFKAIDLLNNVLNFLKISPKIIKIIADCLENGEKIYFSWYNVYLEKKNKNYDLHDFLNCFLFHRD